MTDSFCTNRHPGLDSKPAVFGVVKRVAESLDDPSHTDQQVCTLSTCTVHTVELTIKFPFHLHFVPCNDNDIII